MNNAGSAIPSTGVGNFLSYALPSLDSALYTSFCRSAIAFCDLAISALVSAATTGVDGGDWSEAMVDRMVSSEERSESSDSETAAVDELPDDDAAFAFEDFFADEDAENEEELEPLAYSVGTFAATRSTSLLMASMLGAEVVTSNKQESSGASQLV